MVKPRQGDIYWVRFGVSGDSGLSGKRPAVIIQNDFLNISGIVNIKPEIRADPWKRFITKRDRQPT